MKKSIKVACYCRVSTGSKEQLDSFENQKQFFEEYVKEHHEYELYHIYADKGVSGTLLKREEFEQLLKDAGLNACEYKYKVARFNDIDKREHEIEYKDYKIEFSGTKPKFEEILVKNTSRFARNIMVVDVLRKLRANGVYVRFLDINKSTRNEDDIAIIQFFQQFDEMFSSDLSRKLLAANKQSRQNKILRTNHDLFGYVYKPRSSRMENNRLIAIKEEALIVQTIFRLYLGCYKITNEEEPEQLKKCSFRCSECKEYKALNQTDGLGFRLILHMLNNVLKYRTRKGKEFAQSTLKHIFENEKYAGYINTGKWDHGTIFDKRSAPKIRKEYLLEYNPEVIEPIISKELFDLCTNKRLGKVNEENRGIFKGKHTKYKGLIYCARCGEVYTHNISSDKKGYYNCKTKRLKNKNHCSNVNIFDWQIDEHIKKLAQGMFNELIEIDNIGLINTLVKQIKENIESVTQPKLDRIQELKLEILEDKRALKKLYERFSYTTVNEQVLNNLIVEKEKIIQDAEKELEQLLKKPRVIIENTESMLNKCYGILKLNSNKKEVYTEEEILSNIERLVIYGDPIKENGVWQTPRPSIQTVLKVTNQTKIDITAPLVLKNLGLADNNIEAQIAHILDQLKEEIQVIKDKY